MTIAYADVDLGGQILAGLEPLLKDDEEPEVRATLIVAFVTARKLADGGANRRLVVGSIYVCVRACVRVCGGANRRLVVGSNGILSGACGRMIALTHAFPGAGQCRRSHGEDAHGGSTGAAVARNPASHFWYNICACVYACIHGMHECMYGMYACMYGMYHLYVCVYVSMI